MRVSIQPQSAFMGDAKIGITLDRYGHLMPGSEEEAAGLLDSYFDAQREREEQAARSASVPGHYPEWAAPSGRSRLERV